MGKDERMGVDGINSPNIPVPPFSSHTPTHIFSRKKTTLEEKKEDREERIEVWCSCKKSCNTPIEETPPNLSFEMSR